MAKLSLLSSSGQVHETAGLNWGANPKNHTRTLDAYIPIPMEKIRLHRDLFPPVVPGNRVLTFIWDDGVEMKGLFEGSMQDLLDGLTYPKQISSHPHKNLLGIYLRDRLGVIGDRLITIDDLNNYGRTDIDISLHTSPNTYYFDFSV